MVWEVHWRKDWRLGDQAVPFALVQERGGGLSKWGECGGEEGGTHGTLRKSVWGCDVHSVHEPEGRCAYEEK